MPKSITTSLICTLLQELKRNRACLGLLLLSILLFSPPPSIGAVEKTPASGAEQENTLDPNEILRQLFGGQDLYFYRRENRPDPFMPFIREKVIQQNVQPGNVVEEIPQEELKGLQKFEPGQLSLVAIVFKGNKPLAMVQDPVGQGYIVKEGMNIGRYGIVEEITPNAVVIQQTTRTWDQEKLFKRVEMVLRKEGEQ